MRPPSPLDTVIHRARTSSVEQCTIRNVLYVRRFVACGKTACKQCTIDGSRSRRPTHGPYWYMVGRCPQKQREYLIYIGKELDPAKWRTEDGRIDWPAYFTAKARGKFPNTPAGPPSGALAFGEGPQLEDPLESSLNANFAPASETGKEELDR